MRQRPRVMGQVPAHRGGQVPRLGVQPLQPLAPASAAQRPVRLLGQDPVVVGVPPLDLVGAGPGRQPLGHKLADGLQHPGPGPELRAVDIDQAVAGQRLGQIQRPILLHARDLGRGLDSPAIGEHRRDLQQRPLVVGQQAHAPLHGGPQGALPFGQVYRAGAERVQRGRQPVQQRGRVQ